MIRIAGSTLALVLPALAMGGAGAGRGHHLRQLSRRCGAQSFGSPGQFGKPDFRLRVTEALGIFSLLIALLLLFAL